MLALDFGAGETFSHVVEGFPQVAKFVVRTSSTRWLNRPGRLLLSWRSGA